MSTRIRIAFNPQEERFEVSNPAILKDKAWFADVAEIFAPQAKLLEVTRAYVGANTGTDRGADVEGFIGECGGTVGGAVRSSTRRGERVAEGLRIGLRTNSCESGRIPLGRRASGMRRGGAIPIASCIAALRSFPTSSPH